MIRAILFDADGVLINNKYLTVNLERDYGIPQKITRTFFENEYLECVVGEKDLATVLPSVLVSWGWKESLDEFFEYWFTSEDIPNEPLLSVIPKLRSDDILCCLATNQPKERLNYILHSMEFQKIFDRFYASSLLKTRKPQRLFFERVLTDLSGIEKEEILLWDDSRENVTAAKDFGIQAELYRSFEEFQERMKHYSLFSR